MRTMQCARGRRCTHARRHSTYAAAALRMRHVQCARKQRTHAQEANCACAGGSLRAGESVRMREDGGLDGLRGVSSTALFLWALYLPRPLVVVCSSVGW